MTSENSDIAIPLGILLAIFVLLSVLFIILTIVYKKRANNNTKNEASVKLRHVTSVSTDASVKSNNQKTMQNTTYGIIAVFVLILFSFVCITIVWH